MSAKVSSWSPVAFKDVAIYFSQSQWKVLEGWQMELYRNAMSEIHAALISLGYVIVNPDVVFRLQERDLHISDNEAKAGFSNTSSGYQNHQPDILLRIKLEEKHVQEGRGAKEMQISPDSNLQISSPDKEEKELNSWKTHNSKKSENVASPSRNKPDLLLRFKEETAPSSILPQDSDRGESTDSAMSDVQDPEEEANESISNPKFSLSNTFHQNRSGNTLLVVDDEICQRLSFPGVSRSPGANQDPHFGKLLDRSVPLLHSIAGRLYSYSEYEGSFCHSDGPNSQQILTSEEKSYKCDECDKCFSRNSHLTVHKRSHTGEKPFHCNDCEKTFGENSHLTVHQRIHTGEKRYLCMYCEKSFGENSNLIVHQRIHTGEKPYQCAECDNRFSQHSSLARHMRIHTGSRPYKCTECVKTFSQKGHLSNHMRTHTGERPYKCLECDKAFSEYSHLTGHLKIHTGEKPYKCKECTRGFNKISNLKAHVKIHSGCRPYSCTECGKSFTQFSTLVRHEKIHRQRTEPIFRKLEAGVQDGKIKWAHVKRDIKDKSDASNTEWPEIKIVKVDEI